MATITNQATLSYNGVTVSSNVATGEILDGITVSKTALKPTYGAQDELTYIINIVNSGEAASEVTVTDDLGGYTFEDGTVYPLTFTGDAALFTDGAPTPVTAEQGPPLVFSGITVPAGGTATIVYTATVNSFAPLGTGAAIVNTATVDGAGVSPVTASETVTHSADPELTIVKSIAPQTVRAGAGVTYTFTIGNSGAAATGAAAVSVTDEFDPVLTSLTATLDGAALDAGADYSYDGSTGLFKTVPGVITVPAAAYSQNEDGTWNVVPGETVLTVSGNIS